MTHSAEQYEFLFDQSESLGESVLEALRHKAVFRYRAKTIKSGDILECEIFPIWNTKNEVRRARAAITPEAQRNLNDLNARKKFIRKINANFTNKDLCVTLTYRDGPPDEEQARRDIRNYIRRVREYRRKQGLPEMKYVYVIEFGGADGRRKRAHHHVIMSAMDRSKAEELWTRGRANADRLQPDDYGFEALARYMLKEPKGGKRWCASKNLVEPKITVSDTKVSKRKVEKMALDFETEPKAIFGKLFPEYDFTDCTVKHSDFVAGAYIYARMRKREKPKTRRRE